MVKTHLVKSVTSVNSDVGTSHELGCIRCEEDSESVEVIDGSEAGLWGEGSPDLLLGIEGWNVVEGGVHVTWRDAVDTDVVLGPLSSERLAELDNTGLGGVVTGLLLWVVDDGSRHGSNEDDGSLLAGGNHGLGNSLGHKEGTSQVDIDETTEHGVVVLLGLDVRAA